MHQIFRQKKKNRQDQGKMPESGGLRQSRGSTNSQIQLQATETQWVNEVYNVIHASQTWKLGRRKNNQSFT